MKNSCPMQCLHTTCMAIIMISQGENGASESKILKSKHQSTLLEQARTQVDRGLEVTSNSSKKIHPHAKLSTSKQLHDTISTQASHLSSAQDLNEISVLRDDQVKERRRRVLDRLHKRIQSEKQRCLQMEIDQSEKQLQKQAKSIDGVKALQKKSKERVAQKLRADRELEVARAQMQEEKARQRASEEELRKSERSRRHKQLLEQTTARQRQSEEEERLRELADQRRIAEQIQRIGVETGRSRRASIDNSCNSERSRNEVKNWKLFLPTTEKAPLSFNSLRTRNSRLLQSVSGGAADVVSPLPLYTLATRNAYSEGGRINHSKGTTVESIVEAFEEVSKLVHTERSDSSESSALDSVPGNITDQEPLGKVEMSEAKTRNIPVWKRLAPIPIQPYHRLV